VNAWAGWIGPLADREDGAAASSVTRGDLAGLELAMSPSASSRNVCRQVLWPAGIAGRGRLAAQATAAYSEALLPCLMLAALSTVMACSVAGTSVPSARATPEVPASGTPTEATPQLQQQTILKRICEPQAVDVSVNKCGDFYSTYPTGFVVDAATEIFDRDGERIDSCGGYRYFPSEEARAEAERRCSTYLSGCTQVVASCSSFLQGRE